MAIFFLNHNFKQTNRIRLVTVNVNLTNNLSDLLSILVHTNTKIIKKMELQLYTIGHLTIS